MHIRATVLTALSMAALSGSALAADWNTPATSPVYNSAPSALYSPTPVSGWSGFYAGANVGHGWGTASNSPVVAGGAGNNNSSGWAVGAQGGYNYDIGGLVIGGELDLQWSNIGHSFAAGAAGNYSSNINLFGTARFRAGLPVGQVLPYLTFGVAAGGGTTQVTSPANVTTSTSSTHLGWAAGIGFEAQAASNVSIKAEYLYVDLGSQPYNGLPVGNHDVAQRFGVARVGVNYRF